MRTTFDLTPLYRSTVGFDRLVSLLDQMAGYDGQGSAYPPYNIERTGENSYRITLAVAGFAEPELSIEAKENTLTVRGSRERTEMEDGRFFRYERPFGEFTRSVALPEGSGDGEARAHYANGVLEVHVQKPELSKPRRVQVITTVESGSAG